MSANKARIIIGGLSVFALVLSVLVQNEIVSTVLVLLCALVSIGVLYHKLPELSNVSEDNPKVKTLRFITVFNVVVVLGLVLFGFLVENEIIKLSEESTPLVLPIIFASLMIVFGNIAPKIPYNRYTGLRLPWTVSDEDAWIVAHRILGYISMPCGVLCFAGIGNLKASVFIPLVMLFIWILVPATLSYIFFYQKWHPKKK